MVEFITMNDAGRADEVIEMMRALYAEDPFAPDAKHEQFPRTVQRLLASPTSGRIVMFIEQDLLIGYALLIPFWSNEFGGNVVVIDEIYVRPHARNRGTARAFFKFVKSVKPFDAVALGLEASPDNLRAQQLYRSIGFVPRKNLAMTFRLDAEGGVTSTPPCR